ncbi:recombinase family protein [Cohnella algarum]|uniref:recombinase family protein n=1 Tax=Cohnella algarum TaxID=2044859 RepID=UPI001F07669E|nr:recombinase family protein [Cohnella algarum]
MARIKAALYARVSTEEQAKEGYSIAAQIAEIRRYADQNGFEIVDEYVDEGASGKSIAGRSQMKRLLRDANQHKFGVVIIYKIDRLARKLKDALEISETLEKNNVNLISLNEKFDTTTAFGRTAFQMICSFAEFERNNIVERVKLGMEQRAKEGKFNGGRVLGYDNIDKELVINENEAVIVRKIFDYANQGLGFKAITRRLNEAGFRSKKDKPFNVCGIKTILNNPVYIGKIRYKQLENWSEKRRKGKNPDYLIVDGTHEPIIAPELWESVHQKLGHRSYKPSRSHQPYILSGLLKCPVCGHGMVPARSKGAGGKSYRYYVCGQFHNKGKAVCRSNMMRADVAEEQVLQKLIKVALRPDIVRQLVDKINALRSNAEAPIMEEKKALLTELSSNSRKLQKIKDNILSDPDLAVIFKDDLKETHAKLEQLQKRLEAIEAELDGQNKKPVDPDSLHNLLSLIKDALLKADADEQKALLRLMVESIRITKDSPRRVGRQITQINLHFDFTIESMQRDSAVLLSRLAETQALDCVAPLEPDVLASFNEPHTESLRDLMKSLNILPLAMIRFTAHDLKISCPLASCLTSRWMPRIPWHLSWSGSELWTGSGCRRTRQFASVSTCNASCRTSIAQTGAYIARHMSYAGAEHDVFTEAEIDDVLRFSSGAARLINKVCTHSLIYGSQNKHRIIDDHMIKRVIQGELS